MGGLLLVDGAFPISMFTEELKQRTRQYFRRMALPMKILAVLGRSAKIPAGQAAELNIDLDKILGSLGRDYERLTCPVPV